MRIIHISDLHFPTKIPFLSLRGKAIVGYANYYLRRQKKHDPSLIESLVYEIKNIEYDALIISGDFTNVSFPEEFKKAREWLSPILDDRAFLIPGNHDRYRKAAILPIPLFENSFSDFIGESISENFYLRKKEIAGKIFIGWDSNIPLSILKASGFIDPRIVALTRAEAGEGYFLVCHHPIWNPNFYVESSQHKMTNRSQIASLLAENPPAIYFHGHTHTNWVKKPGLFAPYYVINSASSTRFSDSHHDCGFHIVNVNASGSVDIKRMSYHRPLKAFKETNLLSYEEADGQI